jgi:hypothetical protein
MVGGDGSDHTGQFPAEWQSTLAPPGLPNARLKQSG